MSQTVRVELGASAYDIVLGQDLLGQSATWEQAITGRQVVVVTNPTVAQVYLSPLLSALRQAGKQASVITLPDGEAYKTLASIGLIYDDLLQQRAARDVTLLALGGGVIGDMTGFAAATYMRGVPFVQVPTTLLAQVDSSVGGKTAVNHPLGKNMIGSFYQPRRVVIDLDSLNTLPAREYSAGLAEVVKYGAIMDAAFFAWLEQHMPDLMRRDPEALAYAVRRSCECKAQVVVADEREQGLRATLNFGHTFGHAIEAALGYGTWLHGEAVAAGMVLAAELSLQCGYPVTEVVPRLRALLQQAQLPVRAPALGAQAFLDWMRHDKKVHEARLRYVLLQDLGAACVEAVADTEVLALLRRLGQP
jgi:3-dehydroquinate synthase